LNGLNEWVNGTTVQTYGNSNDWVLAGNVLRNFWTTGMSLWGIGEEDGDGGYQGSLRTVVERCKILCSGQIATFSSMFGPNPPSNLAFNWSGALNIAHVIRRNTFSGAAQGVLVQGQVLDALVESNAFAVSQCPERIITNCPGLSGCCSTNTTGRILQVGPGGVTVGGGRGYLPYQEPQFVYAPEAAAISRDEST
jgi:hypothetical protein